jgi:hypothetical protein
MEDFERRFLAVEKDAENLLFFGKKRAAFKPAELRVLCE